MSHRATAKRSVRSTILGVLSATLLAAASVFGFASAAQAAWVSQDELESGESSWGVYADNSDATYSFSECAISLSEDAYLDYEVDSEVLDLDQLMTFVESLSVSVSEGTVDFWVVIDRVPSGIADLNMLLTVGEHGVDPTDTVNLYDSPELGIGDTPTLQEVWDALELTGDDFVLLAVYMEGAPEGAVQWVSIDGEVHWFGTNATWFTDDPTCGAVQPTRPDAVQTAVK